MRTGLVFVGLFVVGRLCAQRPEQLEFASPNGQWIFLAKRIPERGYQWKLHNNRTGKNFFETSEIKENELFPKSIYAQWAPDSEHVAINQEYGRAVADVAILFVSGKQPLLVPLPWEGALNPLELRLLRPEDKRIYTGWNRLLTYAVAWQKPSELKLEISMLAFLKDKGTPTTYTLDTHHTAIVDFKKNRATTLKWDCIKYTKKPQ